MIERLRRGAQSSLSYILIGVLIVFFAVFFGVPADGCTAGDGSRVHMATVDGDRIYTDDVNPIFVRYFGGGRSGPQEDAEVNQAQARALQIVVTIHLLANRAEEAGLRVSDEEFARFMYDPNRNAEFVSHYGRTGQFSGDYYHNTYVPNILRTPLPTYERFKRKELLARKYLAMLDMQAQATPDEIEDLYRQKNTEVDLEFVRIDRDTVIDAVGIDEEDLDAFLDDSYGQERVREYYDDNVDDYTEPEEIKVSRIRVTKPGTAQEAEQALAEFDDARQRIVEGGEDFATVAAQVQGGDDGDMGWRTFDAIDQDIVDALGDAEVGTVQEIETDLAHMLVKLEDRRDEEVEELEEVERDIAEMLLREDIVDEYGRDIAERLHERLGEGLTFDEALDELTVAARDDEDDVDADADDEDTDEDADEELSPEAQIWTSLSTETTGLFALVDDQDPMAMAPRTWDEVPGLGHHRELAIQAFELTESEPLIDEVVDIDDGLAVIRLHERQDPDDDISSEEYASLSTQVRLEKVYELIGPWREFFIGPQSMMNNPFLGDGMFGANPEMFYRALFEPDGYFDTVFRDGVEEGTVSLQDRRSRAAADLEQMLQQDPIDSEMGDTIEFGQ